ncbi:hypothetical protein DLM78_09545 [Leptospira stimsonii]|uniref:Uncharacterized protein n=1 Tax=Leptospira stimsonii TaxID=2202203 RepID=A0A8B6RYF3_9LEPT|nr:hypothetical protein DLM78_09545 [Leptospira stimsonii]
MGTNYFYKDFVIGNRKRETSATSVIATLSRIRKKRSYGSLRLILVDSNRFSIVSLSYPLEKIRRKL